MLIRISQSGKMKMNYKTHYYSKHAIFIFPLPLGYQQLVLKIRTLSSNLLREIINHGELTEIINLTI